MLFRQWNPFHGKETQQASVSPATTPSRLTDLTNHAGATTGYAYRAEVISLIKVNLVKQLAAELNEARSGRTAKGELRIDFPKRAVDEPMVRWLGLERGHAVVPQLVRSPSGWDFRWKAFAFMTEGTAPTTKIWLAQLHDWPRQRACSNRTWYV